jgi:hypothetical protein
MQLLSSNSTIALAIVESALCRLFRLGLEELAHTQIEHLDELESDRDHWLEG